MADPTTYEPSYSFSDWQADNPTQSLPAQHVDNELADISTVINDHASAIMDIRRSDGKLRNGVVTVDSMDPSVSAGILAEAVRTEAAADRAEDAANAAEISAANAHISEASAAASEVSAHEALDDATAAAASMGDGRVFPLQHGVSKGLTASQTGAFQAIIDNLIIAADIAGDTMGAPVIEIAAGKYRFDTGLNAPPWIKLVSQGLVELNFSSAANDITGVRSENSTPSGAAGSAPAHRGPWLNGSVGALQILGPGPIGSSFGLDMGQSHTGPDRNDFRNVKLRDVNVSGWAACVRVRNIDTHQLSWDGCRFDNFLSYAFVFESELVTNSGERFSYDNCEFGRSESGWAFSVDADSFNITWTRCSFDFVRSGVLLLGASSGYQKFIFGQGCHIEGSSNDAIVRRVGGTIADNVHVTVDGCVLIPTTSASNVPPGARPDGRSTARSSLFKGSFDLTIGNCYLSLRSPYHLANEGLFLCDSDVRVNFLGRMQFTGWPQMISRSLLVNSNCDFADELAAGTGLTAAGIESWLVASNSPQAVATIDDATFFPPSTRSLRVVSSQANGGMTIENAPFSVRSGERFMAQCVIYGGTSTGNCLVTTRFRWYRKIPVVSVPISTITKGTSTVTVTTTVPHGLTTGRFIRLGGIIDANYNRRFRITVTSSTVFTFIVLSSEGAPSGDANYAVDEIDLIGETGAVGTRLSTIYDDTDFPLQTGDRLWWCRQRNCPIEVVPVGAQFGSVVVAFSEMDHGDTIYLGLAAVCPV